MFRKINSELSEVRDLNGSVIDQQKELYSLLNRLGSFSVDVSEDDQIDSPLPLTPRYE